MKVLVKYNSELKIQNLDEILNILKPRLRFPELNSRFTDEKYDSLVAPALSVKIEHNYILPPSNQLSSESNYSLDSVDLSNNMQVPVNINGWKIISWKIEPYYTRNKIFCIVEDPEGKSVKFSSIGWSEKKDEGTNIYRLILELTSILIDIRNYSFFKNYSSRKEYVNLFKERNPQIGGLISMRNYTKSFRNEVLIYV